MEDNTKLSYNLSCLSAYSTHIEQEELINSLIIAKNFYIPYVHNQGAYDNIDVFFTVALFHNKIKVFECDIEFELFDDIHNENELKKSMWVPEYIHDRYVENYFETIKIKDCYILDGSLFIIFDVDLTINGYQYELMYGEGFYDW